MKSVNMLMAAAVGLMASSFVVDAQVAGSTVVKLVDGKFQIADASKEVLKAMLRFEYAP